MHILQVSLLTENGNTKDDLKLPTDDSLLSQVTTQLFLNLDWMTSRCLECVQLVTIAYNACTYL